MAALTTFLFSASACVGDDASTTSNPVEGGGTSEGLAIDSKNNVILVGAYDSASVDVGCTTPLAHDANVGVNADDAFVVKLDPRTSRFPATSTASLRGSTIVVAGRYESNIAIDGKTTPLSGEADIYVVKPTC